MGKLHVVGVDDGHYAIKVVLEDGSTFSVPSRGKAGRHLISTSWRGDEASLYKTEEGLDFTVHEHLQAADDTRFMAYPRSPLNRVLVHHALRHAGLGGKEVSIATGLPVSYYYLADGRRNDALITSKQDNLYKAVSCGGQSMARIMRNVVTTEAIAAYFDQLIEMDGAPSASADDMGHSMIGVVDIGGKTTDCAVIFPGGEQVDTDRSGSNDVGVLMLYSTIGSILQTRFELDNVPPRLVEAAIRTGKVKISGDEEDVSEEVRVEKERLAEQIMAGVRTKIGAGKDLDSVLFVGGGTIVMKDQLEKYFSHSRFVKNPEFANARGMFKIAKYVFGEED
ncbi:ParM/StbA family protein [Castellaniella sp.]|uniref:ParM/StbA family protein n=1 Tax=Castellaniella sp. TaxID=1955812 RepID=UPI002AFF4731|nr:ParM/StbA family protein [Castellaniella sp.]